MLFFASWRNTPDVRDRVLKRFAHTQAQPPEGVTVVGRWHRTDGTGGFMVVEAHSMQPVTEFAYDWNDLLFLEFVPVVDDAGLIAVIEKLRSPGP